jgi:hypothetical protein
MNLAIPQSPANGARSLHKLIGGMTRWLVHGSPNAVLPMQRDSLRQRPVILPKPALVAQAATGARRDRGDAPICLRAVRVLRVAEPGQARSSVGRMVISGRMADVCAELDRLVAREAVLH